VAVQIGKSNVAQPLELNLYAYELVRGILFSLGDPERVEESAMQIWTGWFHVLKVEKYAARRQSAMDFGIERLFALVRAMVTNILSVATSCKLYAIDQKSHAGLRIQGNTNKHTRANLSLDDRAGQDEKFSVGNLESVSDVESRHNLRSLFA